MLNLAEELLLLALEDGRGRINSAASASLPFGLAGAMLMDLILSERPGTEQDRVVVLDPSPTGDGLLDDALREIGAARKPRGAEHWVRVLGGRWPKDQVTDRLMARGVLRRQEDTVLWIIPYARVAALLSLVKSCNLIDDVFGLAKQDGVRKRLDEISERELVGKAVSDTVAASPAAMQAAMSASAIAATNSATASCSASTSSSC